MNHANVLHSIRPSLCALLIIVLGSSRAFASSPLSISNAILSSTEVGATATNITVSATVTDSIQSDPFFDVNVELAANNQTPVSYAATKGAGNNYSVTLPVPVNLLTQPVTWTATVIASTLDYTQTQVLTFTQQSAGTPAVLEDLTTPGGVELTSLDPSGDSVLITADITSPFTVTSVQAQVTSPGNILNNVTLENDATEGPNAYTGVVDIPSNPLAQSVNWTFTVIATVGNNVGTQSETLVQDFGEPPSISNAEAAYSLIPDASDNNLQVNADVTSDSPLTQVVAYVTQDDAQAYEGQGPTDGLVDTITLTKTSGNTYSGAASIADNVTNIAQGWTVRVVATAGNNQSEETTTFTQQPPSAPSITNFTLSPSSAEGSGGGRLSVTANISGLGPDAIVTAYLVDDSLAYSTSLNLIGSSYTGAVSIPANVADTTDKWTAFIGVSDGSYTFSRQVGSFSQTGSGNPSPGGAPSVSANIVQTTFASSGQQAQIDLDVTVALSPNEEHSFTTIITPFANGIPQPGGTLEAGSASDGNFTEKLGIPLNGSGIPVTWTFQVAVIDSYENVATTTVGPVSQPYDPPILANADLNEAAFGSDGGSAGLSVDVTANDTFNSGNLLMYANGVPAGVSALILTSPMTFAYSTGTYGCQVGVPPNTSGRPITWTGQIVDSEDEVGYSSVNLGPFQQPFNLSVDTPVVLPKSGVNNAFASFNGDTANLAVNATADGGFDAVKVDAFVNGVYQATAQLQPANGVYNSNGAYVGSMPVPPNTSGVDQNWTIVFTAIDGGGNFATTTAAVVKQPYLPPTLTGASVKPSTFFLDKGDNATLTVTANSADGTNLVTAYVYANGVYTDSVTLLNAGAQNANGGYNGVYVIPAVTLTPQVTWTFVIVDVDSSGNSASVTVGPVSQGPTITALAPANVVCQTAVNPLTVTGGNFAAGDVVSWNGAALATTFVNANTLTAVVPKAVNGLLPGDTYPGTAAITVTTSAPITSAPFNIGVTEPVPTVASLSPSAAFAGGQSFTMTVTGASFANGAIVTWANPAPVPLATVFVSNTTLTATVPANLIANFGQAVISVTQPAGTLAGGGLPVFTIAIAPLRPTITQIAPASGAVGSVVTITGTNFSSAGYTTTAVTFNGVPAVTFQATSATSITATVPSGATTGGVTVTTPGGTSLPTTFTVTGPSAYLGDVLGAGKVTLADWVKIGRYAAGLDPQPTGLQYQEADCASGSVGKPINLADWVQAGRYAAGLDPLKPVPANSPTAPTAN